MAINVRFNNISQANSEILKAFNSSTSAKALEAYQPLNTKQRKLEKLRALQILKQNSESQTLADISLETDSLAIALTKAEGATLQAMLNLLSAKMIEQNKYVYTSDNKTENVKAKVQKRLKDKKEQAKKDHQEKENQENKTNEESDNAFEKLVDAVVSYFEDIKNDFIEKYKEFLDAISLENLQKAFKEGAALVRRYTTEAPVEFFNEYIVEPIHDFRENLKSLIEGSIKPKVKQVSNKSFSSNDIKSMLNTSFAKNNAVKPSTRAMALAANKKKATVHKHKIKDSSLDSSLDLMSQSVMLKKKIRNRKKLKAHSAEEIKLALHR